MVYRKSLYKRQTLISNLKKVVERIPQLNLPVTIVKIYAFGSILREKKYLPDLDLLVLYTMSQEQEARWENFRINFSTHQLNGKPSIFKLARYFKPYEKQGIKLHDAVKNKELAKILYENNIEPVWAGCFSWREVFYNPRGVFFPEIEVVVKRLLLPKEIKGLHLNVERYEDFVQNKTFLSAKNFVPAWSPDNPDVENNLENRPLCDKINIISKELDHFINEEIPLLKKEYMEARNKIIQASLKTGVKINVNNLDIDHIEIQRTGHESYDELIQKCEKARIMMRRYRAETMVLDYLISLLEQFVEKSTLCFEDYSAEEWLTELALERIPKYAIKEREIREILSKLGLPEHKVLSIKRFGQRTWYKLIKNEQERQEILKKNLNEEIRVKYIRAIRKNIRDLDKQAEVDIEITNEGKPSMLEIIVRKSVEKYSERQKRKIIDNLKIKGFDVRDYTWQIEGIKQVNLSGMEDIKELKEVARKLLQ
ncbi:MAG: hypothetical protein QW279_05715 [Candidatus Jordarchaeaceae archaeon]